MSNRTGTGITLVALRPHQCKWPVAESPNVIGRFLFCGKQQQPDSRYCEEHHKIAHPTVPYATRRRP